MTVSRDVRPTARNGSDSASMAAWWRIIGSRRIWRISSTWSWSGRRWWKPPRWEQPCWPRWVPASTPAWKLPPRQWAARLRASRPRWARTSATAAYRDGATQWPRSSSFWNRNSVGGQLPNCDGGCHDASPHHRLRMPDRPFLDELRQRATARGRTYGALASPNLFHLPLYAGGAGGDPALGEIPSLRWLLNSARLDPD